MIESVVKTSLGFDSLNEHDLRHELILVLPRNQRQSLQCCILAADGVTNLQLCKSEISYMVKICPYMCDGCGVTSARLCIHLAEALVDSSRFCVSASAIMFTESFPVGGFVLMRVCAP